MFDNVDLKELELRDQMALELQLKLIQWSNQYRKGLNVLVVLLFLPLCLEYFPVSLEK
jgi:hypothetical protein